MKTTCMSFVIVSMIVLLCPSIAYCEVGNDAQMALRKAFDAAYQGWREDCERVLHSSDLSDRLKSEHFKSIVAMGLEVLPYIMEKAAEDPDFSWIGWTWLAITRTNTDPSINPWARERIAAWWRGGKKQLNNRFGVVWKQWEGHRLKGEAEKAAEARQRMRALGIGVLPLLIQELDSERTEILQLVEDLTGGKADTAGSDAVNRISACRTWWDKNKEKWLIPFPNKQPVSKAGEDQTAASGDAIELNGSGSTDADEDRLSYRWKQIAGPTVELSDCKAVRPSFTAPQVQKQTVLVFELIVEDGSPKKSVHPSCQSGQSKPDTVKITVRPTE